MTPERLFKDIVAGGLIGLALFCLAMAAQSCGETPKPPTYYCQNRGEPNPHIPKTGEFLGNLHPCTPDELQFKTPKE